MHRHMMKSKLHGATVTQCDLGYVGSLSIDRNLMEVADLLPHEQVQVVNLNTGARFETYVIPGAADTGIIGANGGAARLCAEGDSILIISYCSMDSEAAREHEPKVIVLNEENRPVG